MPNPNGISQMKKCVTFIFVKDREGRIIPQGTGFFVAVPSETSSDKFSSYLVTAKHILQDRSGQYLSSVVIRLNAIDGGSELIEVPLGEVGKVFVHSDPDVDIACFGCLPDQKSFDLKCVPSDMISTKEIVEENQIVEGDEVFFCGLFTSYIGQQKNQPIVRFGRVALMSDEKVEWKEKGKPARSLDLYLLECQSFGGNSGSPVFFYLNPLRKPGVLAIGGRSFLLAGVMMGSFQIGSELETTEARQRIYSLQNAGIAAVTPAYKLHEILFSEELVGIRRDSGNRP